MDAFSSTRGAVASGHWGAEKRHWGWGGYAALRHEAVWAEGQGGVAMKARLRRALAPRRH